MHEYEKNWMSDDVFQQQIDINLQYLNNNNYPQHWLDFLEIMNFLSNKIETIKLLDVGCGSGYYYKICKQHFKNIDYTGIDFSVNAINVCKKIWSTNKFFVMNYAELNNEFIKTYNIVHAGALFDVLPNGDEALDFILSFQTDYVIIGRINFTDMESHIYECEAYKTKFIRYRHNINNFKNICNNNNYNIKTINNTILLTNFNKKFTYE